MTEEDSRAGSDAKEADSSGIQRGTGEGDER